MRIVRLAATSLSPASVGRAGLLALALAGGGCALSRPPPIPPVALSSSDHLLPPDAMMSCPAIALSFRYAAERAARLEHGLAVGSRGTFGTGHFQADAPGEVRQEMERLDALADLQRERGCVVFDPVLAVAAERAKIEPRPGPVSLQPGPSFGRPVLRVRD